MRGRVPRATPTPKLHPLQEELNTFHTHATRAQHGLSVSTRLASELRQTPEEDRLKTGVRKRLLPGRSVMSPGEQVSGDNEEAAERKRCNGQKAANHAPDQQARTPPASASIRLSVSTAGPLTHLSRGDHVLVFGVLVDGQTQDVVRVLQVEALSSCQDRKQEVLKSITTAPGSQRGRRRSFTGRQVLDDHGGGGVEDDVGAIVEVMQVVATVEASVAEDVIQEQLLRSSRSFSSRSRGAELQGAELHHPWSSTSLLTSTTFFFLLTLLFSTLSGSGAALLTGGLRDTQVQLVGRRACVCVCVCEDVCVRLLHLSSTVSSLCCR